jgi:cytosine/adenosine deaminase-related metal-dependent hydrolase
VRLHTHLAEDLDEDRFCLERFGCRPIEYFDDVGWSSSRSWVAHCVQPNPDEIVRLGQWGTSVAHCPSSNMILGVGMCPVHEMRAAGVPVGLGCDGSSSTDSASLWQEARNAMLLSRLRLGPASTTARDALEIATRGGAACLGREGQIGELSIGACGDLAVWPLTGVVYAGALTDPIEAWLRCAPGIPRHTVIAGRSLVDNGALVSPRVDEMLDAHHRISARMQGL